MTNSGYETPTIQDRKSLNPYEQLAHKRRLGRSHVRADELLPGDEIELDGARWTLRATALHVETIRLVLVPGRWEPEIERDKIVRMLRATI